MGVRVRDTHCVCTCTGPMGQQPAPRGCAAGTDGLPQPRASAQKAWRRTKEYLTLTKCPQAPWAYRGPLRRARGAQRRQRPRLLPAARRPRSRSGGAGAGVATAGGGRAGGGGEGLEPRSLLSRVPARA